MIWNGDCRTPGCQREARSDGKCGRHVSPKVRRWHRWAVVNLDDKTEEGFYTLRAARARHRATAGITAVLPAVDLRRFIDASDRSRLRT